jgi:hypothetical protein
MKYLFLLALVAGMGCSAPKNEILSDENCGNLHCVVFVERGDTLALDFLNDQEFDSLKTALEL